MLQIITAAERLSRPRKITATIFGKSGAGKTTLARTLNPETTLFLDLEAGVDALADWPGSTLDLRKQATTMGAHPWEVAKAMALFIGGPNPADAIGFYSAANYAAVCAAFGDPASLDRFTTIFVDSITVASRHAFAWAQTQPKAFSEKTGKPDLLGAYGLLGQELVTWFTHLQHCGRSIFMVGILDEEVDDLKRVTFKPQVEGGKAGRELPGIFDQVMTLAALPLEGGGNYRALICTGPNAFGLPAKDRSGCLEEQEPPDLGALMAKITAGRRRDKLTTVIPPAPAPAPPPAANESSVQQQQQPSIAA